MIDLATLGIDQEKLQALIVKEVAERVLATAGYNEDGNESYRTSRFGKALEKLVADTIDSKIQEMAEAHLLPRVGEYIEGVMLQQTTKWGERVGQPMTFLEYLTQRAEQYLVEQVDYQGKSKAEQGGYSFTGIQNRITYMVNAHLHRAIETMMKDALTLTNTALAEGIEATVKAKLKEITESIKIGVKK